MALTGQGHFVAVTGSTWLLQGLRSCYGSRFCFIANIALSGSNRSGPFRGSYGIYMAVTESCGLGSAPFRKNRFAWLETGQIDMKV